MKKKIAIIIGIIGLIGISIGAFFLIKKINRDKALSKMIIEVEEKMDYKVNEEIDLNSLVKKKEGGQLEIIGAINNKKVGTYKIIYRLINEDGLIKEKGSTIKVIDDEKPVITLTNEKITVSLNNSVDIKKDVTAVDNYDGDITDKIEITGEVDTKKKGTYEIKYDVIDSSGNKADTKTRTYEVQEIYKLKLKKAYKYKTKGFEYVLYFTSSKIEYSACAVPGGCGTYEGKYTVNGNTISAHFTLSYDLGKDIDSQKINVKKIYILTKDGIKEKGRSELYK